MDSEHKLFSTCSFIILAPTTNHGVDTKGSSLNTKSQIAYGGTLAIWSSLPRVIEALSIRTLQEVD